MNMQKPTLLDEVAAEQGKTIAAEIVELEAKAEKLKAEIAELSGDDGIQIS